MTYKEMCYKEFLKQPSGTLYLEFEDKGNGFWSDNSLKIKYDSNKSVDDFVMTEVVLLTEFHSYEEVERCEVEIDFSLRDATYGFEADRVKYIVLSVEDHEEIIKLLEHALKLRKEI